MDIADKLESILDINIVVENRCLEIFKAGWEKGDNVLAYKFDLEFWTLQNQQNTEQGILASEY